MKDTDIITENTVSGLELSGVQIKKDYIGLATGAGNDRSIVAIKPTGITLGSRADLSINTNNFKLQTDASTNNQIGNTFFAIGSNLAGITKNTTINDLINTNNNNVNILINQNCTYIKGTIYATAGRFTGDIVASSFQLSGNTAVNDFNQAVSNSSLATAVNAIEPLTVNGLSSGVWNGVDYGVILGNKSTSKPMLIGSNSGITIAADLENPSKGEAISLTNGGIALHGGTINLTSTSDTETNVISLSDAGINLASTAEINMKSGGSFNVQANMGTLTFKDENNNELTFSVDPDGTVRCKKLYCDELIVDNISTNDGKTIAKTEDSTQSTDGEITTSSFSPNTGYLPGNQGRTGSFTTCPVFNGDTRVPEGYSKADVSLYFTTQDSGYWSVGTARLFINETLYSSYKSYNSSDGSYISLRFNNASITSGAPIYLKITNTVSNQANYIATYSFVPYRSSVRIHN